MKNTRPTFNEILNKTAKENAEMLMKKARLANRLAKRFQGKKRRQAYSIKADALCGLIKSLPNKITVRKDIRLTEFVVVELKTAQSGLHLPIAKFQGI